MLQLTTLSSMLILALIPAALSAQESAAEKRLDRLAQMKCAEIAATRKIESALRVRIVNEYRLEADLDAYMGGDGWIQRYVEYGFCVDLLQDAPDLEERFDATFSAYQKLERDESEKRQREDGERYSRELEAEVARCNLRFRDFALKLKSGRLELWGKMFQGNHRSNCSVSYEGESVSFLIKLKGVEESAVFTPAMFRTTQAPFGTTNVHSSGAAIKDPKDIESITLRINGNLEYGYTHNGIWPDGFEITKVIYAK